MRGVVPMGVTAPRGATRVTLSPACTDNCSASRLPTATPCPSSKPSERALLDVVGDRAEPREVGRANAAHQHAIGIERRGGQRLALDHRRGEAHARHHRDAAGDRFPIGQRRIERLDQQVAVEPEDLVEQLLAEAVHHRHHDDEGRDPEHDAEEGEPGDDRDEALRRRARR